MSSPPPPGKVITSAKTPPGASVRKEFHATGSLIPLLRSSGHSAHPATQLIGLLRPSHHSAHPTTPLISPPALSPWPSRSALRAALEGSQANRARPDRYPPGTARGPARGARP